MTIHLYYNNKIDFKDIRKIQVATETFYVVLHLIISIFISTAESVQLCYTNRYGVVVIVGVVAIVSVVNFLSFDVSIWFLPLIRIIWIKECLITTDSYWRLQFRCWWWKKQIIL